ncbi:MAG: hypothetical protein H0V62_09680 [Gammaproteobacteria bacterium]|nr:hypothetical protein [Gammaproteobacteria bacterium]
MSKERPFFKGKHDTSYGILYPTNYLIAAFDSLETAQRAEQSLHTAGYDDDDVRTVDSEYVKADIKKRVTEANWYVHLRQKLSIGKEACFWNEDLKWAEQGAGFLAVHCPTDGEAQRIVKMIKQENPKTMRRYLPFAIETFA